LWAHEAYISPHRLFQFPSTPTMLVTNLLIAIAAALPVLAQTYEGGECTFGPRSRFPDGKRGTMGRVLTHFRRVRPHLGMRQLQERRVQPRRMPRYARRRQVLQARRLRVGQRRHVPRWRGNKATAIRRPLYLGLCRHVPRSQPVPVGRRLDVLHTPSTHDAM
jgi:hypothetical protein